MQRGHVWVTGIGVISALGLDQRSLLRGIRSSRSGIKRLDLFDTSAYRSPWAGQAPTPNKPSQPSQRFSRADRLTLHAAAECLNISRLDSESDRHKAAVILGTGTGGSDRTTRYQEYLYELGERRTPASWLIPHQPATSTDVIANSFRLHGPRSSVMTSCSSSAIAIGMGLDMIRLGRVDIALVGGVESLCHLTFGGFNALRAIDPKPCRPFHADREGLTLGDGAAILLLESRTHAKARGAQPYARVLGYGISSDAHHLTAPHPHGRGAIAAMEAALRDARILPAEVDYINAHGTATLHNDLVEAKAIQAVFGGHAKNLMISSTKAMTGHTLGAAGAIEAAVCCLSISEQIVPPTLRLDKPDEACGDLDFVPLVARSASVKIALSNSFAFGGNNTTVVFSKC